MSAIALVLNVIKIGYLKSIVMQFKNEEEL
jgi:hypothetical protein